MTRGSWIRASRSGLAAAPVLGLALAVACNAAPVGTSDATLAVDARRPDGGPQISVAFARTFGQEGETPTFLVVAGPAGKLHALTDRADYLLDGTGRVLGRWPWPVASGGARAQITSASWDGAGLGATVRWGVDATTASGTYLALTDPQGRFKPAEMILLGPASVTAVDSWNTQAHHVMWSEHGVTQTTLRSLKVVRPAAGGHTPATLSVGLPTGTSLGGVVATVSGSAACTVEPGGKVKLRRFAATSAKSVVVLNADELRGKGRCALATSGRSHLVTWTRQALPPHLLDAGADAADLGSGAVTYDYPAAQVVDPSGRLLPAARSWTAYDGTKRVESVIWDGARYLVLINAIGHRGGRLLLTALDEAGSLVFEDLVIPVEYEPGRLVAGKLVATPTQYYVFYSRRRPEDQGVLHLARFTID